MVRNIKKLFKYSVILLCLLGCVSLKKPIDMNNQDMAKACYYQMAAAEISDVFVKGKEIYIKYSVILKDSDEEKIFYSKGFMDSDDKCFKKTSGIIPLEVINEENWEESVNKAVKISSLSQEDFSEFKRRLAYKIASREKEKGVVVRIGEEELIFFYDNDNNLKITDMKQKPSNIIFDQIYNFDNIKDIFFDLLNKFTEEKNIFSEKVIFTMNGQEEIQQGFFYADLNNKNAVTFQIQWPGQKKYQQNFIKKGWKTADYLIFDSHVFGFIKKPFSSINRLLVWTKDTAYDLLNPKILPIESNAIPYIHEGPGMDLSEFEKKLDKVLKNKNSSGSMEFLIDGDEFFPRLIESLLSAERSIYFRIFIFDNDDYAVQIADILKQKAKQGVEVKVLLDRMGQIMGEGKIPLNLPAGFVPPHSMIEYLKQEPKIDLRVRPSTWMKADHIKTIIVDRKICFTGGMNIGREYRYSWHDMMIKLTGPVVIDILNDFKAAWVHSGFWGDFGYFMRKTFKRGHADNESGYQIRLLFTRLNNPQIYRAQLLAIREAKKYIFINNAYFSDSTILYELIKARRRGVDVRVILPVNGNHEIMNKNNVITANTMFNNGIKVYFYPGMSHIKAAIYDNWACTGTANFDRLSLLDNLELNLSVSQKTIVEDLKKRLFEKDFEKSVLMREPLKSTWKDFFARILAKQL